MINVRRSAALASTAATLVVCAAAHASTLTVKVDPPASGTAASPQAHTTSIQLDKIDPGPTGDAKAAPVKLVESLPADFAVTMGSYASCPSSKVVHNDNKPDCPDGSIVGTASGTGYVPALAFRTTSDRGYIYKLSDNTVRAWVHFSTPQPAGIVVTGTFASGSAPFGPTITWDLKSLGDGTQAGVEVRIDDAGFVWTQHEASGTGQAPSPPAGSDRARAKKARANCIRKARRIKNKSKRRRELRHCAKLKAKPAPQPAPQSTQGGTASALSSTGCTNGSWPFRAQMTFTDGTSETADASVACTGPPQPAPPGGGGGGGGSPVCPPVCVPPTPLEALTL
jgi:hypothetical protein